MGLITLSGDPVICIIIIAGKQPSALVKMVINNSAQLVGNVGDEIFKNNGGEDKLYPAGSTCNFRGKTVLCFIRWNEKGGITSLIFTKALKQMDHLGLFPRTDTCKPMILVDDHDSRFGLDCLEYINNPTHLGILCIEVSYGATL